MCCGFGEKACGICGNADGNCLASMRGDYFFPATKEQVEMRLAEGWYACDKEIMEEYVKTAREQKITKTTVCCESKTAKGGNMIVAVLKGQYAFPIRCNSCPVFKPEYNDLEHGFKTAAKCMADGRSFGFEDNEFLYKGRKRPNWCPLREMKED